MEKAGRQVWLAAAGVVIGGWRRGLAGAAIGGGLGYLAGSLLSSAAGRRPGSEGAGGLTAEPEGHYLRYPEEEVIDALQAAGESVEALGAELEGLYREVVGPGGSE